MIIIIIIIIIVILVIVNNSNSNDYNDGKRKGKALKVYLKVFKLKKYFC